MKLAKALAALTAFGFVTGRPMPPPSPRTLFPRSPATDGQTMVTDSPKTATFPPPISWVTQHDPPLPPYLKGPWTERACDAAARTGCRWGTITEGPHLHKDPKGTMTVLHGDHVHMQTDKHDDMLVYSDGTATYKDGDSRHVSYGKKSVRPEATGETILAAVGQKASEAGTSKSTHDHPAHRG